MSKPRAESEILDRQPPAEVQVEKQVIGSILMLPNVLDDMADMLEVGHFYDEANGEIYRQMVSIRDGGEPIDHTLVIDRLKKVGQFERIGGLAYLAEVAQSVPTAAHAVYYAKIVHAAAKKRAIIQATTETLRDAYDESIEPDVLVSQAERRIFAIAENGSSADIVSAGDAVRRYMLGLDSDDLPSLSTGYVDLDDLTGGLKPGELTIVAARPSMGKTALALNSAQNLAVNSDVPVLVVSLEMGESAVSERLVSAVGRVDSRRLQRKTLNQDERTRALDAQVKIDNSVLQLCYKASLSMTKIAAIARRAKRAHGIELLVIDYLTLIESDSSRDPRQEQVAQISRRLKALAIDLDIPVMCAAQLNREGGDGKPPQLHHLRESGAIEQDADVVVMLHRPSYYKHETSPDVDTTEAHVRKNRNGRTGMVKLTWHKKFTRFENAAQTERYSEFDEWSG